ncbi:MAG: methylated-DNA--[protein]-cysteine S-methyltransferase [Chlorobiales bacterium]|nr:methylated-DNA--[protein]-cysteine S-methyltransferase [Chlorobiales bacterium]
MGGSARSGDGKRDLQGTALRTIPPGLRVSYSEVAQKIGRPRSVRAVASACVSNRIAAAIPCHRVVRKNGDLAGYRWGIERKKALLEKEMGQVELYE